MVWAAHVVHAFSSSGCRGRSAVTQLRTLFLAMVFSSDVAVALSALEIPRVERGGWHRCVLLLFWSGNAGVAARAKTAA